jgi:DNA-dependent RNA polymerase auxiliary subunit epsilon
MDRFEIYKKRLANLDSDKRFKFEFINSLATTHSDIRIGELHEQYLIRRRVAVPKYKDYKDFENDELFKANDDLRSVNLPCDLMKFYGELRDIDYEIDKAKEENRYNQIIDHQSNMIYLFSSIFFEAQLEEYLNMSFDFDITIPYYEKYDIKNLKDFDKVIELLALFKWIVRLKNMIETVDYNRKKTDVREKKELESFDSLFLNPQIAKDVKRILKENDYINDSGQWISSGKLKRIVLPYYVLKDEVNEFGIIRSGSESKQLKIWCKEFGINASYDKGAEQSLKNLLKRPEYDREKKKDYIEFFTLLESLKKFK